jgi:hypothetical protein
VSAENKPGGLSALGTMNVLLGAVFGLIAVGLAVRLSQRLTPGELLGVTGGLAATGVGAALGILSGFGLHRMSRFWGYTLANFTGLYVLGGAVVVVAFTEMPFNLGVMAGLVYPVMLLALLNTVFREDFQ